MRKNLVDAAHALKHGGGGTSRRNLVDVAHALKHGGGGTRAEIWWMRRIH
jgi:hypothetical protein